MSGALATFGRKALGVARMPRAMLAFLLAFPKRRTRVTALRRFSFFTSLGLAYNKVKKNANTSVVLLLSELETGMAADRRAAKHALTGFSDLPAGSLKSVAEFHYFVVVRDPFSRVLSAFLDKFRHERYRRRHGDFPLTPSGFGQFLAYLEKGGLSRDAHWDLQIKSLVWPLQDYDTVIRFESFGTEFGALLAARGMQVDHSRLGGVLPTDTDKQTAASARLDQFYTPERRQVVRRLFAADFAALGY